MTRHFGVLATLMHVSKAQSLTQGGILEASSKFLGGGVEHTVCLQFKVPQDEQHPRSQDSKHCKCADCTISHLHVFVLDTVGPLTSLLKSKQATDVVAEPA